MIDIRGLDKADVLCALYNASRPQGMGWLRAESGDMTPEQARKHLSLGDDHKRDFPTVVDRRERLYFDYLNGRVLKVDITDDTFEEHLYDRDLGRGAARAAIDNLKKRLSAPSPHASGDFAPGVGRSANG
jgi:hypothetical protein